MNQTNSGQTGGNGNNGQTCGNNASGQTSGNNASGQTSGNFSFLGSISPRNGTILAALIADLLADGLDSGQLASLAAFITIIGDSLAYISAQMDLQEDSGSPDAFV